MVSQPSALNSQRRAKRRGLARRSLGEGGFALLIVLTLLGFVLVLLLGLAAYSRVETAISGNTQRQAQARQHALVALDVALAQLQKHAGPDQRVTATGESTGGTNAHYTGVWSSDPASTPSTAPLTWLVSGSETPANNTLTAVQLVGSQTAGTGNNAAFVTAPLVNLKTFGVPGQFASDTTATGGTTIGHYAWWIGDQGVKAPVALGDNTAAVNYAPFVTQDSSGVTTGTDLRDRIRQQISLGAAATDENGAPVFDPRDSANATPVKNVTAFNQLAFLKTPVPAAVGLTTIQKNFHNWSPNNFNVLANTRLGGLRQDLSLDPTLLGSAFTAWADFSSYMETPDPAAATAADPNPPAPLPNYDATIPVRRRYKITSPLSAGNLGVAPVLTYFYVLFGVRKQTALMPYTLSLRWAAALWNPYTSALVPEDLRLEISGLPTSITTTYLDPVTNATVNDVTLNLRQLYGDPLKVTLPWTPSATPTPAEQSWLPGRVYNWVYLANASLQLGGDNPGQFGSRDLGGFADGLSVSVPGSPAVNGGTKLALRVTGQTTLTVKLVRANGDVLATYTSPLYDGVPTTTPSDASGNTSQIGFLFRLAESVDTPATPEVWLTTPGRDPRSDTISSESLLALPNGSDPAAYRNFVTVRAPERLFDRDITTGTSYNEDVPLFELPRTPLLSLGELQHLYLPNARPFAVGNSWGSGTRLNSINIDELFDRFYFSGLVATAVPDESNANWSLPNPLLKRLRNSATGALASVADLRTAPAAQSSKFLLQGGGFNLNSVNTAAWGAVLRSVRFPSPQSFSYLDADATTGTAADTSLQTVQSGDAQFFRFAQSAQETYKADDAYVQSTTGSEQDVINTPLFRRGMRTLTADQVVALANQIVVLIQARHAASGPFSNVEQFINPASSGNPSLLEQAIVNANINANIAEFSSQWLTQGDIMTALAPVLFPRSDTFVIRTYGEAVNPATSAIEGKAWCEAIVQRVPEYLGKDANAQPEETAPADLNDFNKLYGRRFKIISFRWLTRSDI